MSTTSSATVCTMAHVTCSLEGAGRTFIRAPTPVRGNLLAGDAVSAGVPPVTEPRLPRTPAAMTCRCPRLRTRRGPGESCAGPWGRTGMRATGRPRMPATARPRAARRRDRRARTGQNPWEQAGLPGAVDAVIAGFEDVVRSLPQAVDGPCGERRVAAVLARHARTEGNGPGCPTVGAGTHVCVPHRTATTARWSAAGPARQSLDARIEDDLVITGTAPGSCRPHSPAHPTASRRG